MQPITTEQFEFIINQIGSSTSIGLAMAAPLTWFLVSLLKRFAPLATIKSEFLAFTVALGFQAVLLIGGGTEGAIPFETWWDKINTVVPMVVGIIAALGGSSWAYRLAEKWDWPIVGYKRPEPDNPPTPPAVG